MRWLLLILVFDISNGGIRQVMEMRKVFNSEAACEAEGRQMAETTEYPGENIRSLSICIPENAFDER